METRAKIPDERAFVTLTRDQWSLVLEAMRAKVQLARCIYDKHQIKELQLIERLIESAAS